jgi:hypothetical protein
MRLAKRVAIEQCVLLVIFSCAIAFDSMVIYKLLQNPQKQVFMISVVVLQMVASLIIISDDIAFLRIYFGNIAPD